MGNLGLAKYHLPPPNGAKAGAGRHAENGDEQNQAGAENSSDTLRNQCWEGAGVGREPGLGGSWGWEEARLNQAVSASTCQG